METPPERTEPGDQDERPVVTVPEGHPDRAYARRGVLILPLRFARRMPGWQDMLED